jgi:hypothetical protein
MTRQNFFQIMTAEEYRQTFLGEHKPIEKGNKYHAQKTEVDGIVFDSKWEAERYNQLSAMQRAGQIKDLQRQVKFVLLDGYTNNKGEIIRPICYMADFQYIDNEGRKIVEDTKSPATKTDVFKIKKKLFESKFKDYIFIEKYKK